MRRQNGKEKTAEETAEKTVAAKTAYLSMISAFAIVLSYVESLIPIPIGIYGIKLGLANFVILICLYKLGIKEAMMVNLVRIAVIGFLFGNLYSILFSLAGAAVSLAVMALLKKTGFFGMAGVSAAGGVAHNLGQLAVAAALVSEERLFLYMPVLTAGGVITGTIIGILAQITVNKTEQRRKL